MTHGDVFTTILIELGVPKENIKIILNHIIELTPGTKMDALLTEADAAALLAKFRSEKESIRAWLADSSLTNLPPEVN